MTNSEGDAVNISRAETRRREHLEGIRRERDRPRRCTECGKEIDRRHDDECIHSGYVALGETLPWKE